MGKKSKIVKYEWIRSSHTPMLSYFVAKKSDGSYVCNCVGNIVHGHCHHVKKFKKNEK
jgi:hypothetical protein